MSFQLIHKYQRAVDEGLVDSLKCPEDGERMFTTGAVDKQDELQPVLICYLCNTRIRPGLEVLKQLEAELARL